MKTFLLLNDPNLNLLGTREPGVYGSVTLADVEAQFTVQARTHGFQAECFQSNHEGALIDQIHTAGQRFASGELLGVVFNPGAFTHTSIALFDAIQGVKPLPVIEVHISNVHTREAFRHHSYISPAAAGIVVGFGVDGYRLALDALIHKATAASAP